MKKALITLSIICALAMAAISVSVAQAIDLSNDGVIGVIGVVDPIGKPAEEDPMGITGPTVTNERYATFLTVATFEGVEFRPCRLMTSLCPDRCGHAGNVATFSIDNYIAYGKYNEYGDGKDGRFLVKIDGGENTAPLIDKVNYAKIKELKKGSKVLLSWNHLYVTKTEEGGFSSKYPERPINFVLPISDNDAKLIPSVSAPTSADGLSGVLDRYYVTNAQFYGMEDGQAVFSIKDNIYTYYNSDVITLEFLAAYTIDTKTADKVIVDEINKLKAESNVILAFRRDIIDNTVVQTPLFVLAK